ncbi:MAG: S-layer homology domain-containing protein [Peptococcaceae bacterium]
MNTRNILLLLFLLATVCIFPAAAGAATMADIPQSIGAPVNIGVGAYPYEPEAGEIECFEFGFSGDDSVRKFGRLMDSGEFDELGLNSCNISVQVDYKYNENGSWHYRPEWDTEGALFEAGTNNVMWFTEDGFIINGVDLEPAIDNEADLQNNTLYFRLRFWLGYYNGNTGEDTVLISPWSETVLYGKNAAQEKITALEAPVLKNVELQKNDDGRPYFEITAEIPESVKKLNNGAGSVTTKFQMRKTGEAWGGEAGSSAGMLFEVYHEYPEDTGGMKEINIAANTYEFRMRFEYSETYAGDVAAYSPYSNVLTLGTPAFYKGASSWAAGDLSQAAEYGFITDRIKDNMGGPVTREEFAEILVKFHEKITGKTANYQDMSAFVDTTNPEIFKAFELGLVKGKDLVKKLYAPNDLIKREEIAAMIQRAAGAVRPDADFSTTGAAPFPDEQKIDGWALDVVRFAFKNRLITGLPDGRFDPQGTTTREQAVLIILRTYEKYK